MLLTLARRSPSASEAALPALTSHGSACGSLSFIHTGLLPVPGLHGAVTLLRMWEFPTTPPGFSSLLNPYLAGTCCHPDVSSEGTSSADQPPSLTLDISIHNLLSFLHNMYHSLKDYLIYLWVCMFVLWVPEPGLPPNVSSVRVGTLCVLFHCCIPNAQNFLPRSKYSVDIWRMTA